MSGGNALTMLSFLRAPEYKYVMFPVLLATHSAVLHCWNYFAILTSAPKKKNLSIDLESRIRFCGFAGKLESGYHVHKVAGASSFMF